METSLDEFESWYYFIKYDGNEEPLNFLNEQLNSIEEMILCDGCSTFDLDIENLVSEQKALEMIKIEVNSVSYHRKFNGVLEKIDFRLNNDDSNTRKIKKMNKVLGNGKIENFIDKEDIDESNIIDSEDEC